MALETYTHPDSDERYPVYLLHHEETWSVRNIWGKGVGLYLDEEDARRAWDLYMAYDYELDIQEAEEDMYADAQFEAYRDAQFD